jgi:hypothetical protein
MPRLEVEILPQPDETTCGPTCLHAVYRYFGDEVPLESLGREVPTLEGGGTLGAHLGCHALQRGYSATLYTYNLQVFDPTWFRHGAGPLPALLQARLLSTRRRRLQEVIPAYLQFLELGGIVKHEVLTAGVLLRYLDLGIPILTGLSATYLYQEAREIPQTSSPDAVRGDPVGHFVVLCGRDPWSGEIEVADPYEKNPLGKSMHYRAGLERVLGAILLGVLTFDGNLLVIEPKKSGVATC